jgi:hypothetical protein
LQFRSIGKNYLLKTCYGRARGGDLESSTTDRHAEPHNGTAGIDGQECR